MNALIKRMMSTLQVSYLIFKCAKALASASILIPGERGQG